MDRFLHYNFNVNARAETGIKLRLSQWPHQLC